MTTTKSDDLEAVRQITATLEPFETNDRERILRWVREKLAMPPISTTGQQTAAPSLLQTTPQTSSAHAAHKQRSGADIKSFVETKAPSTDSHFVATVAYYHRFEAPPSEKKDSIGQEDLLDACRKVPWKRPSRPLQTLINAEKAGLIDKVAKGQFRINSVGENLVAMVLPESASTTSAHPRIKSTIKKARKNAKPTRRSR